MDGRRVGPALGSGTVRGFAHVGVLRVLEREGIKVDCVAGTSCGIAVGLHSPSAGCPSGPFRTGVAAIEYLIAHAGDDSGDADVHMPIPAWGLSGFVFTSHHHRLVSMGEKVAEQGLPEIRAAFGEKPPEAGQGGSGSR